MSLSNSEAEWKALSEALKEDMFLESMKISVKLPLMLKVDNTRAIFMAGNAATSCSNHVDIT